MASNAKDQSKTGPLRIGVAGCGRIAEVSHVPRFQALRDVAIVALCDQDLAKTEALRDAQAPQATAFTDYQAMLASGLDAVAICTPNSLHYPMARAALEAGLHVLVEKPMTSKLREADRLVTLAATADRVLHVNQTLRYIPLYVTVADLVAKGAIGTPIHARCIRAGGSTPNKGWSPGADWFVSKAFGGGLINDLGVHMADLLQWIMGDVAAVGSFNEMRTEGIEVVDNATAIFRFVNGGTGVLELSWTLPAGAGYLEVYGSTGSIRVGFGEAPIQLTRVRGGKATTTYPPVRKRVPDSFRCFVDAVQGKAPSPTDGRLGRSAVALCQAMIKSGDTGRIVKL